MYINRVCHALEKAKVPYALVGGVAVALHGAIRGTVDMDIVLVWTLKNLEQAEKALQKIGYVSLLPINAQMVFQFRDEYIQNRNLIAWIFYNPKNPLEQVDIIINYDLKNHRSEIMTAPEGKLRVLSLSDLIAMKKEAGRLQDKEDIKALEAL
jgi:hypothetical protein